MALRLLSFSGSSSGGGASASFTTIQTPLGSAPVATGATDTLTFSTDTNLTITGNSGTDTVAFALASTIAATLNGVVYKASVAISASAIDWSLSNTFTKTISGNTTFTFSNTQDGQTISVYITAGAGNTVTWPTVKWQSASAPTQTSSGTDIYTFTKFGSVFVGSYIPAVG